MNGETFKLINKGFPEKSGLTMMNAFPLGFRHFYTKKPVKDINDLKGLRMRVPNIPLYLEFAKQLGQSGQPMPFAEVPSALDQGRSTAATARSRISSRSRCTKSRRTSRSRDTSW